MPFLRQIAIVLALFAGFAVLSGCGVIAKKSTPGAPPPVTSVEVNVPPVDGNKAELEKALAEPTPVGYYIKVVPAGSKSVDEAFAGVEAQVGKLQPHYLLLVIFPDKNHDIRFAMGSNFLEKKVSADELLAMVRSEYLPEARKADPATGLVRLVRGVNKRMGQ